MRKERSDKRVFKSILRSVAADELSPNDYAEALNDLRSGSMINLLDDIFATLAGTKITRASSKGVTRTKAAGSSSRSEAESSSNAADKMFEDIKRRKINRRRLDAIIKSIDAGFASASEPSWTIRELVGNFRKFCTDRQWKVLSSIVNGEFEQDSYLNEIANR